jgi:8-oxo-dGTP pyrophosphatase MutT (NUDIX family)
MNEKIIFQGRIVEVIEREVFLGEKTKTFELARRSPGVRLIIIKDGIVHLSKEFRHETQGYDFRLPGGKVFDELHEYNEAIANKADILEHAKMAAIKEAHEEMGIIVKDAELIHKSVCGSTIEWDLYYFMVTDFEQDSQNLEDGEVIEASPVSIDEAKVMCLDGRIDEERSAMTLLRYLSKN